jgi:hypothetical protein
MAASMAAVLLTAGTKGKRYALPNARIMIHQGSGGFRGNAPDAILQIAENAEKLARSSEEHATAGAEVTRAVQLMRTLTQQSTAALGEQAKSLAGVTESGTEVVDAIRRIHDGAIGPVLGGQVFWNQGGLWSHEKRAEWTDGEWQIRNWLYFTWLSGDHIVEQHMHNIDVANWVIGAHPVKAVGVGGRQRRTDPVYGHIYDHCAVDFE